MSAAPFGGVWARRGFMAGAAGLAGIAACPAWAQDDALDWVHELQDIEKKAPGGAQLGAYILDTGTQRGFGWRAGQLFPMCSSFKFSLAALVLQRIAQRQLKGNERIRYRAADLIDASPVTAANLKQGMTLLELAEAAQVRSDNTATNLLLRKIGGPQVLTQFWRKLGDTGSRLDDYEPAMNRVPPGEARNTTSPRAIAMTVSKILTGGGIPPASRDRLLGWMHATQTGSARLRAGIPPEWWAGDKTGTGYPVDLPGSVVDLAFVRPPRGAPFVVTAFLRTGAPVSEIDPAHEATLARVGALAAKWASARR